MEELILHHYPGSPFAEKVRLMLGFKNLAWRSVEISVVPPRPLLEPLTAGFRRTPILQVGADLYCDTRCIAAFLEARRPELTLHPPGSSALSQAISWWVEPRVFAAGGALRFQRPEDVTGAFGPAVDVAGFAQDRLAFMGAARSIEEYALLLPAAWDHTLGYLAFLESSLADGRPFLAGDAPSLADFSACVSVWRLRQPPVIAEAFGSAPHAWPGLNASSLSGTGIRAQPMASMRWRPPAAQRRARRRKPTAPTPSGATPGRVSKSGQMTTGATRGYAASSCQPRRARSPFATATPPSARWCSTFPASATSC